VAGQPGGPRTPALTEHAWASMKSIATPAAAASHGEAYAWEMSIRGVSAVALSGWQWWQWQGAGALLPESSRWVDRQ
jgi:hypothetical protein